MEQQTMPIEQVLQAQFAKVGQLQFQLDIIQQQMIVLENENNRLKEQLQNTEIIDILKQESNESDLPR